MARPKVDPLLRYADVLPLWYTAETRYYNSPRSDETLAELRCDTLADATKVNHRLNEARIRVAEHLGKSDHVWFSMIVRLDKQNFIVSIHPRAIVSTNRITYGGGKPLSPEERAQVQYMMGTYGTEEERQRQIRYNQKLMDEAKRDADKHHETGPTPQQLLDGLGEDE